MVSRSSSETAPTPFLRARCRCGHLPTHHMVVVSIGASASFRLDPSGPCALCGDSVCHRFTPGSS